MPDTLHASCLIYPTTQWRSLAEAEVGWEPYLACLISKRVCLPLLHWAASLEPLTAPLHHLCPRLHPQPITYPLLLFVPLSCSITYPSTGSQRPRHWGVGKQSLSPRVNFRDMFNQEFHHRLHKPPRNLLANISPGLIGGNSECWDRLGG